MNVTVSTGFIKGIHKFQPTYQKGLGQRKDCVVDPRDRSKNRMTLFELVRQL